MKATTSSLVAALVAAIAGLGAAPAAMAGGKAITTPASACVLQDPPTLEALQAIDFADGVRNRDAVVSREVICPVVRSGEGGNMVIFVDGKAAADGGEVSCSVQSRNIQGKLLAQKVFSTTSLNFDAAFPFLQAEAPRFSYQQVKCRLPPNRKGQLHGVTSLEF